MAWLSARNNIKQLKQALSQICPWGICGNSEPRTISIWIAWINQTWGLEIAWKIYLMIWWIIILHRLQTNISSVRSQKLEIWDAHSGGKIWLGKANATIVGSHLNRANWPWTILFPLFGKVNQHGEMWYRAVKTVILGKAIFYHLNGPNTWIKSLILSQNPGV